MVGIFQMFGISFTFWVCVGILRFIFETLHWIRAVPRIATAYGRILANIAGVGVGICLFLLFLILFRPFNAALVSNFFPYFALSILSIWLSCAIVGSYLASRIHMSESYVQSCVVSGGLIIVGIILLLFADVQFAFSVWTLQWSIIWITATILATFLGGHLARGSNALEQNKFRQQKKKAWRARVRPNQVAVVIAAYNEAESIGATLAALLKFVRKENIYVGSDGSLDDTVSIARSFDVNVDDIQPNGGKANALTYEIEKNNLLERYKAIMIFDAEIIPEANLFELSLPMFDDPDVAVVVNRARAVWPQHFIPRWHLMFTAYRVRLWRVLQFCIRYGQTWKYLNASPIIPGGSSIYRTAVLKHIRINVPGLIIEDFNMTFCVHHQKLGLIAFNPYAYIWDQEPYSLRDYVKQVKRWYLGFFQTVRHHGPWPSWFFFSMAFFTFEQMLGSVMFLLTPFFLFELLVSGSQSILLNYGIGNTSVTLFGIIVTIFVIDYIVTIVVALIEKKPLLLVYWPVFFPLRYIESIVFLYTMVIGLFAQSKTDGRWISPKRMVLKASS